MGLSILELVLRRLREAQFKADVAYPGQKYPQIREPVATVHIEKVDRAGLTVTMEVSIICPASYGGTACEVEALRATEILQGDGAVCIQNGCSYDGVAQVYVVNILATYICVTEEDDCTLGPGFEIYIDKVNYPFVTSFGAEENRAYSAEYEMGEPMATGISPGRTQWNISMEELILPGSPEYNEPEGTFTLEVVRAAGTEIYYRCKWLSIRREMTRAGLKRIQKGIALYKEVKR